MSDEGVEARLVDLERRVRELELGTGPLSRTYWPLYQRSIRMTLDDPLTPLIPHEVGEE